MPTNPEDLLKAGEYDKRGPEAVKRELEAMAYLRQEQELQQYPGPVRHHLRDYMRAHSIVEVREAISALVMDWAEAQGDEQLTKPLIAYGTAEGGGNF